ncbi:MAG: hypothetical protein HUJ22_04680 [Gracilimonas sp.]|uniref:hypothetical protein n=1 Tax=Gracilimonas sp. TaxID=1974203 RepID=UPI00198B470B|nr:hypothetical protein [Gracilimonas sp.]MBD3615848.1 hypothetical protein [Gracilimonas sp.]
MELINENHQQIDSWVSPQAIKAVEIPSELSRRKAKDFIIDHSEVRGGQVEGIPTKKATNLLYRLYTKIGAIGELPENDQVARSYLNDLWIDFYLTNNLVPDDIPFPIIINEFTSQSVKGRVERKGNNQQAMITAFNGWITRQDVRSRLYQLRDQAYPQAAPQRLSDGGKEENEEIKKAGLVDFSPAVVKDQIEKLEMVYGNKKDLLKAFPGAGNYVERLYNTEQKYKSEGKL